MNLGYYLETVERGLGAKVELVDDWSYIYDDLLEETVRVQFLGQGFEKTAYLNEDQDTVYVITENEYPDQSLQALSYICKNSLNQGSDPNPHLPCVIYVGYDDRFVGNEIEIYKMPYYQQFNSPELDAPPLEQKPLIEYEALIGAVQQAKADNWVQRKGSVISGIIEYLPSSHLRLKEALNSMLEVEQMGYDKYDFDLTQDNVGVDADGNLVLFDVFYIEQDSGMLPSELMEAYKVELNQKPTLLSTQEWINKET